jgi:hypothetical protein
MSAEKQRDIGLSIVSKLEFCDLPGMNSVFPVPILNSTMSKVVNKSWEDVWEDLICPCVGSDENINLSSPQKALPGIGKWVSYATDSRDYVGDQCG